MARLRILGLDLWVWDSRHRSKVKISRLTVQVSHLEARGSKGLVLRWLGAVRARGLVVSAPRWLEVQRDCEQDPEGSEP